MRYSRYRSPSVFNGRHTWLDYSLFAIYKGHKLAYVIRSFAPPPPFIRFSYADELCCSEDRPLKGTKQLVRYP